VALGNVGTDEDLPALIGALNSHDEALVRGHAAWAAGRLGGRAARHALERAHRTDSDPFVQVEARLALEHFG
jgi:epoxyqueuosine reductase